LERFKELLKDAMKGFTMICVAIVMVCVVVILWTAWYEAWKGNCSVEDCRRVGELRQLVDSILSPAFVAGGALFGFGKQAKDAVDLWIKKHT